MQSIMHINLTNRNAVIMCDENQIIKKLSYADVWLVKQLFDNFISLNVPDNCFCIGLFMNKNVYFPSLIISLVHLHHCFVYLTEHNFNKLVTNIGVPLIISQTVPESGSKFCIKDKLVIENYVFYIWMNSDNVSQFPTFKDMFCVIQTSGSTGDNKMIHISYNCIETNALSLRKQFGLKCDNVVFWGTPLTFDPSLIELLVALQSQACLLITSEKVLANPNALFKTLFKLGQITFLQMVPSLFFRWTNKQICYILQKSYLKILALGGEIFPQKLLNYSRKEDLQIFNLYGVTELSCWATIHNIRRKHYDNIPLGQILDETFLELHDDEGNIVTMGYGEIYLGSNTRKCIVNNTENKSEQFMVATGDFAEINENGLFYIARKNKIIKRFGHRINLTSLETLVFRIIGLENRCIYLEQEMKILLFILIKDEIMTSSVKNKTLDKIKVKLLHSLPENSFPDFIDIIPKFPLNNNGKIDENILKRNHYLDSQYSTATSVKDIFTKVWCSYFGTNYDNIQHIIGYTFFEMGGNSFLAIQLLSLLKEKLHSDYPEKLVTLIYTNTFEECLNFLDTWQPTSKRKLDEVQNEKQDIKNVKEFHMPEVNWTYDLKACVDCSPLIFETNGRIFIAIGSFSHIFALLTEDGQEYLNISFPDVIETMPSTSQCCNFLFFGCFNGVMYCVDVDEKCICWSHPTGDRIKSTPILCRKFSAIAFGSYDKNVYCLSVQNGTLIWKTPVHGSIASSLLYDKISNKIYVATLKGMCYCLCENDGNVFWSHNCDSPVFSTPCFTNDENDHFVLATVGGLLLCFSSDGEIKWKYRINGNVFASIRFSKGCIYFGSQNAYVYKCKVTQKDCQLVINTRLNSSITSSPYVHFTENGNSILICACDSGYLYGFHNTENFKSQFIYKFPDEIFSSPVVFNNKLYFGCRDNNLYSIDINKLL